MRGHMSQNRSGKATRRAFFSSLAATAVLSTFSKTALAEGEDVLVRRHYVNCRFGQIHMYSVRPAVPKPQKTPLLFFHQNPKSSIEYKPLLLEMGKDRMVLAMDTPGYGGSDRPDEVPNMSAYAGAMADALDSMAYGDKGAGNLDVFGFHTGAFIASELAVSRPDLVRRVVLSGVAYMTHEERAQRFAEIPRDMVIPEDGTMVMRRWHNVVTLRDPSIPIERAAEIFLDDIKSLNKYWYAYNAVWTYPVEERFKLLRQPVLLLQPHEMLLENTRNVKRDLLPDATLIEIPGVTRNVFETGTAEFAEHLRAWLDSKV